MFSSRKQECCISAPNGDPKIGSTCWEGFVEFYGCKDTPIEGQGAMTCNRDFVLAFQPDNAFELVELLQDYRGALFEKSTSIDTKLEKRTNALLSKILKTQGKG